MSDYQLWDMQQINGKEFWNVLESGVWPVKGLETDPIFRESALRIDTGIGMSTVSVGHRGNYFTDKVNQMGKVCFNDIEKIVEIVKVRNRPFTLWHLRYEPGDFFILKRKKPSKTDMERFSQWYEVHKDAFLGFCLPEFDCDLRNVANLSHSPRWDPKSASLHPALAWKRDDQGRASLMKKYVPSNFSSREEIYRFVAREFKRVQKILFGKVFTMTDSWMSDHFFLELGATAASVELTGDAVKSHQLLVLFTRGAARQYKKPWGTYIALYLGGAHPDCTLPPSKIKEAYYPSGYHYGVSPSMNRRDMYFSYVAGTNFVDHESQSKAFIEKIGNNYKWSPHGEVWKDWFEFTTKNPDRGIPYTPVGLLFDYYHGWDPDAGKTWYRFAYDDGDFMIDQLVQLLIPWKGKDNEGEEKGLVNTPFGDIFDALVANPPSGVISRKVLGHYRLVMLMGKVRMTPALVEQLMGYVQEGGTLLVNAAQRAELFPGPFLGVEGLKALRKKEASRCRKATCITLSTAKIMMVGEDDTPLVLRNQYGKGVVWLTLPRFLMDHEKKMLPFVPVLLDRLLRDILPFKVDGRIQYLVTKRKNGWWITLINNKGVIKPPKEPARIDGNKSAEVTIQYQANGKDHISELVRGEALEVRHRHGYRVIKSVIPPGDVRIIQIDQT